MLLAHYYYDLLNVSFSASESCTVSARPEVRMVEKDEVSKDKEAVLSYGLTTAEIIYRRPDCHWLLQTYVSQDDDMYRISRR